MQDHTIPIKVIHPRTERLETQPDVNDVISISEASTAQLVVWSVFTATTGATGAKCAN